MKKNFKFNRLYHYIFGEKFYKKLEFNWNQYPSRYEIIQETINRKNYKSYLEIGCDQDELFSKIIIDKKIHTKKQVFKAFDLYDKINEKEDNIPATQYPEREIIKLELPKGYVLLV